MLKELFGSTGDIGNTTTGTVESSLSDGYYRININGTIFTARNQSDANLSIGSTVTITNTTWGRFIVSAYQKTAVNIPKYIIRG